MRPRVFPAEDPALFVPRASRPPCFNEAAGIPRGRHHVVASVGEHPHASMRPRVFPAEDLAPLTPAWSMLLLLQ